MKLAEQVVVPELSAERSGEIFRRIQARRAERQTLRLRVAASIGALAVAASVVIVGALATQPARREPVWVGSTLVAARDDQEVRLSDGSTLRLGRGTRIEMVSNSPSEARLVLRKGAAQFDVQHLEGRVFCVSAPGVEVRVTGTRFSVGTEETAHGTQTRVSVEQGSVEVIERDKPTPAHRVEAGQRWTVIVEPDLYGGPGPIRNANADAPDASAVEGGSQAMPEDPPATPDASAPPVTTAGEPSTAAPSSSGRGDAASRLFDRASQARRQGRFAEAMRGYEAFVARYPSDRRASLAALELGRLRMSHGGDPASAARAFEEGVDRAGDPETRADSLANLVMAYDRAGDVPRCRAARDQYLKLYPQGVHLAELRHRCAGP